jgi:glycosyltransferase involved in cell wall biosynthesis
MKTLPDMVWLRLKKICFWVTSSSRLLLWKITRKHQLTSYPGRALSNRAKSQPLQPLVSIIIPTHRPDHFKTALKCALNQTYSNTEIIVSDNSNSSNDSNNTEIAHICSQYPRIVYRKNLNGEAASNIAQPLALATGDYIKYLFDDDLIYPHCIASMMGCLNQVEEEYAGSIGLITSARQVIDDADICYAEIREPGIVNATLVDGIQTIKKILIPQNNFIGEFSTMMFKRDLIDHQNPESIFTLFGEDFRKGLIDVPLYLSILQKSNLLYIPYSLSAFRQHAAGGSNIHGNANFHHAVSDWFRLIRVASLKGLLDDEETRVAVRYFLGTAKSFSKHFPEQLAEWQAIAIDFVLTLSRRTS